jgi:hypothetical protein
MRILCVIAAAAGLSACVPGPPSPVSYANSGWRTGSGAPLSIGEVDALRTSCNALRVTKAIDTDQPVASPIRDNPIYRPGGEALANAPATGLGAVDQPLELRTRRIADIVYSIDECLYAKGLAKIP